MVGSTTWYWMLVSWTSLPRLEYTSHGFEKQVLTNPSLTHYGLVSLLSHHTASGLDERKHSHSNQGWIVAVSYKAYHVVRGKVELSDWHFKKDRKYDPWVGSLWTIQVREYNILFIKELADQVEGSNICCLSLHTSRSDRYWSQQTSRSSHLSLMFSYHYYS